MIDRILFVDDEELVLRGASRLLAGTFEIETCSSAEQGLEAVRQNGPYAAVVSDMHMPGMSGATFLQQVAQCAPLTSRLILTGHAEVTSLIEAVNVGQVFRLLCKPCPVAVMRDALSDAIGQYRLLRSESLRLEQALHGSVRTLSEVLAIVNPTAFHRASRICKLAMAVAEHVGAENVREIEQAATLSQLGCITVSEKVLISAAKGIERLNDSESEMLSQHQRTAARILSKSPLLLAHARIIRRLQTANDSDIAADNQESESVHLAARILRVASDFDLQTMQGVLPRVALARMAKQTELYDEAIVAALAHITQCVDAMQSVSVGVADICTGMTIEQEVVTKDGRPLIKLGTQVTEQLLARLRMFANNVGVCEPILVSGPPGSLPPRPHAELNSSKSDECLLNC